jgi:hypothetical protein
MLTIILSNLIQTSFARGKKLLFIVSAQLKDFPVVTYELLDTQS